MSGHSKWSTIKRQKGAADSRRSSLFTKLSRAISIAARDGNDPETNFRLRLAIDRAHAENMPGDTIERARARGSGANAETVEELLYEGFGPGGAALLIRAVTDNRNRTSNEVRAILGRLGGTLAGSGSVRRLFTERGVLVVPRTRWPTDADDLVLHLIDAGALDLRYDAAAVTLLTDPGNLAAVERSLAAHGITGDTTRIERVAQEPRALSAEQFSRLRALINELEAHDDITSVETNAPLDDAGHPRP